MQCARRGEFSLWPQSGLLALSVPYELEKLSSEYTVLKWAPPVTRHIPPSPLSAHALLKSLLSSSFSCFSPALPPFLCYRSRVLFSSKFFSHFSRSFSCKVSIKIIYFKKENSFILFSPPTFSSFFFFKKKQKTLSQLLTRGKKKKKPSSPPRLSVLLLKRQKILQN